MSNKIKKGVQTKDFEKPAEDFEKAKENFEKPEEDFEKVKENFEKPAQDFEKTKESPENKNDSVKKWFQKRLWSRK